MALVNNNMESAIAKLEGKLKKCVSEETVVSIHYYISNGTIMRYSGMLNEFSLTKDCVYLVGTWFQVEVNSEVLDIRYIEEDNSVCIIFTDGRMDIDLD